MSLTNPSYEDLVEIEDCTFCLGDGVCPDCDGSGCDTCDETGACPECDGYGWVEK